MGQAIHVSLFYLVIFTIGIARGFYGPAQFALLTQLIQRKHYSNSSAWNSTLWQIAAVSGPVIGGYVIAHFGYAVAYIVIATLLLSGFTMFSLIGHYPITLVENKEGMWHNLTLGWRFVLGQKIILGAILLDMLAVLFGGATALLPMFAGQVLHVGPVGLGYLRAAPGIGAIIMALYLTYRPPTKNAGIKLLISVGAFSVTMIVFALSQNFFLSIALLAISGAFDSVSVVIRQTILQFYTPDNMRGRVSAVSTMFIGSSNEIGAFESGTAAKLLGLVPSVIFGGITSLVSVLAIGSSFKSLRTLDLTKDPGINQ